MKPLFAIAVLLLSPSLAQVAPPKTLDPAHAKNEEWQYTMRVKLAGTRSEVRTGVLTKDGLVISGKTKREILETPYGKLEWCGDGMFLAGWQPYVEPPKKQATGEGE